MHNTQDFWRSMLPHVPFEGWTEKAAIAALHDLGYPEAALSLFIPNGLLPVVQAYCAAHDHVLEQYANSDTLLGMRTTARIVWLVKQRILLHQKEEEATRRTLAFFMRPWYTVHGLEALWKTADTIWYLAGDKATDWNHYSKRLLLSYVYATTLCFWLEDHSADYTESWSFLDRRLEEVLNLGTGLRQLPEEVHKIMKRIPFLRLLLPHKKFTR